MDNRIETKPQRSTAAHGDNSAMRNAIRIKPVLHRPAGPRWFEPSKSLTAGFMLVVATVLFGLILLSDAPDVDKPEKARQVTVAPTPVAGAPVHAVFIRISTDGHVRVLTAESNRDKL